MKKIKSELKTKRLTLRPMTDEEIRALIASQEDGEMKKAYTEMLSGCLDHPEVRDWYAPWLFCLKNDGTRVGDACFKGAQSCGAVEIGYGVDDEFQNKGYCTEAARELIRWAFAHEDVFFAEAEADASNAASLRVIEKLGFKEYGMGEEGPRFVLERPSASRLPIYMCLGMSLGMAVGLGIGNMSVGMCTGMALGAAAGGYMDKEARGRLEKARKIRETDLKFKETEKPH